jgi:hypothetical protein
MQISGHAGDAPRQDLTAFGDKFAEQIGVFIIQCLDCDIDAPPRHGAIGATEIRSAFGGFRFHKTTLPHDAGYGVGGRDYIFSFPSGLGYWGFFYYGWKYSGRRVYRGL